jgi:predicted metal-dependent HD superfamily phosphohydrolase
MDKDALITRWRDALPGAFDDAANAVDALDVAGWELLVRWSEPARRYHTVDHLTSVLAVVDDAAAFASDIAAVRLAAWFHDSVYDPHAATPDANEQASADLAAAMLPPLGVSHAQIAEVVRLVLLTADHRVEPGDSNGALLADADLAILAADADQYRAYADAVRAEYGFVPDDAFVAGRSAVLAKLLDLDSIYHLTPHRDAWESRARTNLTVELTALIALLD